MSARRLAGLCLAVAGASAGAAATGSSTARLCEQLGQTSAGERRPVTVSGIYAVSFEFAVFYDPEEPECEMDVQPATSVEFAPGLRLDRPLVEILEEHYRAYVTFRGVLWGPAPVGEDDESLPPMFAYANRIGGRRYGHHGAFRTRLVVEEVVDYRPVPSAVPHFGEVSPSRRPSALPVVVSAQLPRYPDAAQRAGIEGRVVLDVTIEDGAVVRVEAREGDRILAGAAAGSVQTWKFESHVDATFTTTFDFRLEPRATGSDRNDRLELALPSRVTITGAANRW